jgi:hypothetical protein
MEMSAVACVCGKEFAADGSGCPVHGTNRFCPVCLHWYAWLAQREGQVDVCSRCAVLTESPITEVDDDMLDAIRRAVDATAVPDMDVIENAPDAREREQAEAAGLKSLILGYALPQEGFIEVAFSDWFRTSAPQQHLRYQLYRLFANARGWLGSMRTEVVRLRQENANLRFDLEELRAKAPAPEPERTEPETVDDLRLSARVYKLLASHNIRWISDLVKMSPAELLELPGCGITSVKIIEGELARLGLKLRSDDK